jgi:hypothetical protein
MNRKVDANDLCERVSVVPDTNGERCNSPVNVGKSPEKFPGDLVSRIESVRG